MEGVKTALQSPDHTIHGRNSVIQQLANNATQQQLMLQMMAQMVQMVDQMALLQ